MQDLLLFHSNNEYTNAPQYTTFIACVTKRSLLTVNMDILFQRRVTDKLAAG
jgi:hypothetical protein